MPWDRENSHVVLLLHHNQSYYSPCARCPSQVNYDVICQTIHGSITRWNLTTWHRGVFHKLTLSPLGYENDNRNHLGNMIKAIICALPLNNSWYPAATLWSKPSFRAIRVASGQFIMTSLAKHFTAPQILKKLDTDVSFTNSLNHCPKHHCAKKASIETTREQLVIVMSQLLAASSCIDDVTIGQHFESLGAVTGQICGFTSIKPRESHNWLVHRIHGVRNIV